MYDSEWKYLEKIKEKMRFLPFSMGYSPLSMVERWVPILVIFLYISLMIGSIVVTFNLIEFPFEVFK
jgi:hypothetical protein